MRRLIALALLLFTTASSLEAVVGVMRDGEVHHEGSATAAAHAELSAGDHGHEDVSSPANDHEHGEGHEHGTSSDHCTHMHGVALASAFGFALFAASSVSRTTDTEFHIQRVAPTLTHPPRV